MRSTRDEGSLNILRRESIRTPRNLITVDGPSLHLSTLIVRPAAAVSYTSSIASTRAALTDGVTPKKSSIYDVNLTGREQTVCRRHAAVSAVTMSEKTAQDGASPKGRARIRK